MPQWQKQCQPQEFWKALTMDSVQNICGTLNDNLQAVTELVNASKFGFDNTTKRVTATDEVWRGFIEVIMSPFQTKNNMIYLCLSTFHTQTSRYISFLLIQFHSNALAWGNKTIDYDKLVMVFRKDVPSGQFIIPSYETYMNHEEGFVSAFQ